MNIFMSESLDHSLDQTVSKTDSLKNATDIFFIESFILIQEVNTTTVNPYSWLCFKLVWMFSLVKQKQIANTRANKCKLLNILFFFLNRFINYLSLFEHCGHIIGV